MDVIEHPVHIENHGPKISIMDIIEHPVHIEYNFSDNSMPSNDTCLQTKDVKKKHVKFEYPILGRMRCRDPRACPPSPPCTKCPPRPPSAVRAL